MITSDAMHDPKLHSHIEDGLPNEHPLTFKSVYCPICGEMLHAGNNECMQTWVETGRGNFCIPCFAQIPDVSALDDEYGLADGSSASAASPNIGITGATETAPTLTRLRSASGA